MTGNLYLIGMPGSGKSVVAKNLAKRLHCLWVDMDSEIELSTEKTIVQLFEQMGEKGFRRKEAQMLASIATRQGLIVSTGGGIIVTDGNAQKMRQSGTVIWLDRPIACIVSDIRPGNRPLLQGDYEQRLHVLYAQRQELYRQACHRRVVNDETLEGTIEQVLHLLEVENN